MTPRALKYIHATVGLCLALLFIIKFGQAAALRAYILTGIGNCQRIPLLCAVPEKDITRPTADEAYLLELAPYRSAEMELYLPQGFTIFKEEISRVYKERRFGYENAAIHLVYEKPNFFVNLFPQVKKQGVKDNYEFLSRITYAQIKDINNLTDAFFAILKTMFSPNLGDQKNIKIIKFSFADKKGYITYNLSEQDNYFDCGIITDRDDFIKVYIKDKGARLDLGKVFTIISTVDVLR